MNNSTKKGGFDGDLRSLLKNQHRKVYSVCRLFARNYKEHQLLFMNIIAAASQNIRTRRDNSDKNMLLLQACINMAALHTIARELEPAAEQPLQFKSPDYQRSMTNFHNSIGELSDYDKFRVFLEFEKASSDELATLTGVTARSRNAPRKKEPEMSKKTFNFIPYLKEKLIWS